MSIKQNIFNLSDLNKKYNIYKTNYATMNIDLLRFIKKNNLTNINIQFKEKPPFISLEVTCTTLPSINRFKSYEEELKKEFSLKLIKIVKIEKCYEHKITNICKYTYIDKNNTQFKELMIEEV